MLHNLSLKYFFHDEWNGQPWNKWSISSKYPLLLIASLIGLPRHTLMHMEMKGWVECSWEYTKRTRRPQKKVFSLIKMGFYNRRPQQALTDVRITSVYIISDVMFASKCYHIGYEILKSSLIMQLFVSGLSYTKDCYLAQKYV